MELAGSMSQLTEEFCQLYLEHIPNNQNSTWKQTGAAYSLIFTIPHSLIFTIIHNNKIKDIFEKSSGDYCWPLEDFKFIFYNYLYAHVYVWICLDE